MQRAGDWLVEIKTFTGKKTLMNAVALVLHTLWFELIVYKRVCYNVARSGGVSLQLKIVNFFNPGIVEK
jgi:hypothetical protein